MIGIYWIIDIVLVFGDLLLTIMIVRNYYSIGFTRIGRLLLVASLMFLLEGLVMLVTYYKWAIMGYDETIALPSLAITASSLVGMAILYYVSKL
ncbi:MAG: hypothetical protein ACP5NY_00480 [Thermocladium sp.]